MKASLVFILLLAAGAAGAGDKPPVLDPVPLRARLWYLPDTLDTYKADLFSLLPLAKNIYAPLVSTYMDGAAQGMIAESWTVSPDGLTWRFRPRRGLLFQGGTPVTAQAIVSNFRRILWLTRGERLALNALLPELKTWKSYDAPLKTLYEEKGEVVFIFGKRPKNLFEAISQPIYNIADPECFDAKGEWRDPFCPGGSGEYQISLRAPDRIVLRARHIYKRARNAPEVVELAAPTAVNPSYVKSLVDGNAEMAISTSLDADPELLEIMKPAGIRHRTLPELRMSFAMLNPFRAPFNDPELRRSFRDVFLEGLESAPLFSPDTKVDASFIPKGAIGYARMPVVKGRKPLLSHAGEKVSVFLNKKSSNLLKQKRILSDITRQAVIDALEKHGLKLEIIDPSAAEYWERMGSGDYSLLLQDSVVSVENPFESLRTLFMREKGDGLPVTSGKIGAMIESAEASSDPAERRTLAEKINRAIFDEAAIVTYAHSGLVYLYKPGVDLSRCSMFLSPIEFRAVSWTPAR